MTESADEHIERIRANMPNPHMAIADSLVNLYDDYFIMFDSKIYITDLKKTKINLAINWEAIVEDMTMEDVAMLWELKKGQAFSREYHREYA